MVVRPHQTLRFMLMRKRILFGVIAAALVVLNVAVFAVSSVAAPPEPPVTNGCYQTFSYCKDGATLILRKNCTVQNTGKQCRVAYCTSCFSSSDPWTVVDDKDKNLDLERGIIAPFEP